MNEAREPPPASTRAFGLPPRSVLGFTGAVLAIIVIAVLARGSLLDRTASADRVTASMEAAAQLSRVVSLVKDAETGARGYLIGSDRYLAPYTAAVEAIPRELKRARDLLAHDSGQLERFDRLERLITYKLHELALTVDKKAGGDLDGAIDLVRTDRGENTMDEIRTLASDILTIERTQLSTRNAEFDRAALFSLWVTLGGLALLLVLVLGSAILSSRDFREQQWQAWLRTGLVGLAARLGGNLTVEKLGDNAVRFLAEYLGAQVGAIYFSGGGELRCVGSYALAIDTAGAAGGLNEQVLKDGTTIVVDDVPAGYFKITSALGGAAPRRLVITPTTIDGDRNGTIELGFLRALPLLGRELLQRGGEILGVALRAARYRREVEALLEETQRQAEELQTQQEELRVSNEELEHQSQTLIASQTRLQKQQTEVEEINSQLESQRDALIRAQADLQRASAYKSEFLANVSHELRTPLNSSLILARLLADNRDGNLSAEQVKFAETIYTAGNDLLLLINDILDLAKIEAGKLDVRIEGVAPQQIVDQMKAVFAPIANDKHLSLETLVEPGVPAQLQTDASRLQQILKNLLSNACKFTDQGGVKLTVRRAPDAHVAFEVTDTGIGIASEQHDEIFEAFNQADGTTNRRYGGTGLGLSISRDLARLLGGELRVESAPGHGSSFTLVIPEVRPGATARSRQPTPPEKRQARLPLPGVIVASVDDDRAKIGPSSRTILIIEEDIEFLRVVQGLAREHDFMTLGATTAEEGLALAERFRPSAIVLDVHLPDRSGLTVLDTLKHSPRTRHIPVHVISGSDHTQAALEMGAAGYAIKPIPREELVDVLRRLENRLTQKLRRVLVVEDDPALRDGTCRLLAADDVETVAAGTAADALARLSETTFDCVVLDLSLPDKNGFDVLEAMSQKESTAFPPVIVYTGRALTHDDEQRLRRYSSSIIIKGARSPERLLHEVTLFLHQVESELPPDRQHMLREARHREAVFEGRTILVVEDDVRNVFALSRLLEPKGAKVEIARNGREALSFLSKHPQVDLVLMDVMMPEMNGLDATREIRKQPTLANLPIIAITAKAMADDRDNCLRAGANDYIAKPLDVDKLLSLARVWMVK